MRIVFVTDSFWPRINGLTVSVDAFSISLIELGHEVHIVTNRYDETDRTFDARVPARKMHRFPSKAWKVFSEEDFQVLPHAYFRVYSTLVAINADIVHIHTAEFSLGQIAKLYAWRKHKPLVMSSHTHWEQYIHNYVWFLPLKTAQHLARFIMHHVFRNADLVIAPSVFHRDMMVSYGLPKSWISVLPTGFKLSDFDFDLTENQRVHDELHKMHPQLKSVRKLLFVGRIGKEKNVDLLLDVMDKVVTVFPDTILLMVGDGPYRKTFAHLVHMRGLQEHFIFTGYIDHWKIKYFYSEAEVFTFPSISETQGMVTVEAMACKTPVVAVGEMGTFFVMGGDNGGFMVPNDADAFAHRVIELLADNELRERKANEAYNFAQGWSINKMTQKLLGLYDGLLNRS